MTKSLVLASALALASGCLAYNEECTPYISDPDRVAGWLDDDVQLDKSLVRTDDNALGQLVANAYYSAFDGLSGRRPDVALVNSGLVRSDGICQSREAVPKGPVKRRLLKDVLPFDNEVVMVPASQMQLRDILEHAAATYSKVHPNGAFLQLHGALVTIDCSKPPEKLRPDGTRESRGSRIQRLGIVRRADQTIEEVPVVAPAVPATTPEGVWLAIDSYLLEGNDGFVDFPEIAARATPTSSGGATFETTSGFFGSQTSEASPWPAAAVDRITVVNCP